MKRTLLQTLDKQTKALAIPLEQLEKIAAFAPEDEKRARERVLASRLPAQACLSVKALAHASCPSLLVDGGTINPAALPDVDCQIKSRLLSKRNSDGIQAARSYEAP